MECAVLGWPPDGPTLRLDHERFAYAGKFVMSATGTAVARAGDEIVGAVAFSPDRTDEAVLRLRYVTVRRDRQGEGIGPRLLRFVADRARDRDFANCLIAVNNPAAYEAAYRAGFAFTGEETGVAELVLADACGTERSPERYREGLDVFAARELPEAAAAVVDRAPDAGLPDVVESSVSESS